MYFGLLKLVCRRTRLILFLQIVVIQACQKDIGEPGATSATDDPNQAFDPRVAKAPAVDLGDVVELRRPHTVLLMSTVAGGDSLRGAFTGAIAETFHKVDGKSSIYTMFSKSKEKMSQLRAEQTFEMRTTLKKELILPPAFPQK